MSSFYCFYQLKAKDPWSLALASERENIQTELKPELMTILDVDSAFETDMTAEDFDKLRYKGPMYFDFDSASLDEVIPQFQKLLVDLKGKGVNLDSLRLFCSGGKGFHIEMPPMILMGKMPPQGILGLPHIYREVAHELFVETLDLRVYTAKKGRQWRCPNVERSSGTYKVQITAAEALDITPERYAELVAGPRPLFPTESPTFNSELGLIFSKAKDKVELNAKRRKTKKATVNELKKFGGQWPEALKGVLNGTSLRENTGWNKVCIQLSVVADNLGKKEEDLLADAEGLIDTYQGDSERYGSVRKRRQALSEMFRYIQGNPCYEYSVGGVLSLLTKEAQDTHDLSNGEYTPPSEPEEGVPPEEVEDASKVKVSKSGIYAKEEFGWRKICDMGISGVMQLRNLDDEVVGYEADLHIEGHKTERGFMTLGMFMSKAAFQGFTMSKSVSMQGSDSHASMVSDILRKRVTKMGEITYVVQSEGIDLVIPPGAKGMDEAEIVWASPAGVISTRDTKYRYRPTMDAKHAFNSDLALAPDLSPEDRDLVFHLLNLNSTENMAKLIGWFSAAFLCPIFRRYYKQFPSLQVYGQAGAGKSRTVSLLNHLNYYLQQPSELAVAGQTQFPIISAIASSSSIPVVFEEMKPRELSKTMYDFMLNVFRTNYGANMIARGSLSKDSGNREPVVNKFANRAPTVFVGEALEVQSAVLERCIVVSLSKQDRHGRGVHDKWLEVNQFHELGKIGKALMECTLALNVSEFCKEFSALKEELLEQLPEEGSKREDKVRPIYNLAVALMGLRFFQKVLNRTFGTEFDEQLNHMQATLMGNVDEHIPEIRSEASKVLDTMAQLSKIEDVTFKLQRGREYTVDGDNIDIKLKPAYARYMKYMRSLGLMPLYDTDSAFIAAMSRYEGTKARACPDNQELFDSPFEVIYRFSAAHLEKEEVEPFKE